MSEINTNMGKTSRGKNHEQEKLWSNNYSVCFTLILYTKAFSCVVTLYRTLLKWLQQVSHMWCELNEYINIKDFEIKARTCSCGSIIRGQRRPLVTRIAFSVETWSLGRPSVFHWRISNASASTLTILSLALIGISSSVHLNILIKLYILILNEWKNEYIFRLNERTSSSSSSWECNQLRTTPSLPQ